MSEYWGSEYWLNPRLQRCWSAAQVLVAADVEKVEEEACSTEQTEAEAEADCGHVKEGVLHRLLDGLLQVLQQGLLYVLLYILLTLRGPYRCSWWWLMSPLVGRWLELLTW